ncbi:hypothetical protein QNI16_37815 [Cytophagaceae bacterium YF14B1]|uniref:Uncharacterized protein n=1 Tax=Xanthocytophaga flava TaxID=3048013 RepID=A0AAE3UAM2_9BACT|nr:hypothetical protein [Xanthocytophaga flavus]MDJ1486299.1 hypothetical protein [Xanthocytophaga flavus]
MKRVLDLTTNHWKATGSAKRQTMILPIIFQRMDCINKIMEGVKTSEYESTLKALFDFLSQKAGNSKAVILPMLEVVGGKPNG